MTIEHCDSLKSIFRLLHNEKGRFTTSQFIVKKDMPKEKIKRNHVIQIFRKRISEY